MALYKWHSVEKNWFLLICIFGACVKRGWYDFIVDNFTGHSVAIMRNNQCLYYQEKNRKCEGAARI